MLQHGVEGSQELVGCGVLQCAVGIVDGQAAHAEYQSDGRRAVGAVPAFGLILGAGVLRAGDRNVAGPDTVPAKSAAERGGS
ncbi:hypothetical protein NRF20_40785 [Streptomyces sp. R-74717]|uniref:hypothetical protein n=1 Tax=Streptomyces TaxID=1883 RepID=UPI00378EB3A5